MSSSRSLLCAVRAWRLHQKTSPRLTYQAELPFPQAKSVRKFMWWLFARINRTPTPVHPKNLLSFYR
jgi:hypothetical protein